MECGGPLRVRGGERRQRHYYHLQSSRPCRQEGKSLEHLQVQYALLDSIGQKNCFLERRFPEIRRIADVCCEKSKLIIEVQCSPISIEEVKERNRDYESIGYRVLWILHEKSFRKRWISAAENFLLSSPHYFTNINKDGKGKIYDTLDTWNGAKRQYASFRSYPCLGKIKNRKRRLEQNHPLIQKRAFWEFHFQEDILDYYERANSDLLGDLERVNVGNIFFDKRDKNFSLKDAIFFYCLRPIKILWYLLLEKSLS